MDGYLYTGPTITGGSVLLTEAQLGNAMLRTIAVGQSEKIRLTFTNTASADKALYDGKLQFGAGCEVEFL
jgi:hypothetical protein